MKIISVVTIFLVTLLISCTQSTTHSHHEESQSTNSVLYDEIMKLHDEIMPQMEDIYQLKKSLNDRLINEKDIVVEKKQEIEMAMHQLDSANNEMMSWMHKFKPVTDSTDQEKSRVYLELEMEKIKTLKSLIAESIEKAKSLK